MRLRLKKIERGRKGCRSMWIFITTYSMLDWTGHWIRKAGEGRCAEMALMESFHGNFCLVLFEFMVFYGILIHKYVA